MMHTDKNMSTILGTKIKVRTLFYAGLTAAVLVACGKKSDDSSPSAPAPTPVNTPVNQQPTQPVTPGSQTPVNTSTNPGNSNTTVPPVPATTDPLAVSITNSGAMSGQTIPTGQLSIQFGLVNAQANVAGISLHCSLSEIQSGTTVNVVPEAVCTSPTVVQLPQDGSYTFSVRAIQDSTQASGTVVSVSFTASSNLAQGQVGTNPNSIQQPYGQPGYAQPGYGQPGDGQLGYGQPGINQVGGIAGGVGSSGYVGQSGGVIVGGGGYAGPVGGGPVVVGGPIGGMIGGVIVGGGIGQGHSGPIGPGRGNQGHDNNQGHQGNQGHDNNQGHPGNQGHDNNQGHQGQPGGTSGGHAPGGHR